MDRPTASPASARDIILEIVRKMKEGLEPLHYSTLPPAIYHVYLHPDDMDRLRGILPRIVDEAKRALDAEVEQINRGHWRRPWQRSSSWLAAESPRSRRPMADGRFAFWKTPRKKSRRVTLSSIRNWRCRPRWSCRMAR